MNIENVGCIIQARMTSTRLPGKVLKIIDYENHNTILEEVIRRVQLSSYIDQIVIATTTNTEDDGIVQVSSLNKVLPFRGEENDVLSRYYHAAKENQLKHIVRITADCPFIDPYVIDDLIELYFCTGADYCSNCLERSYPHGLDCEIFSFEALEKSYFQGTSAFFREHVTPYIYMTPDTFNLQCLKLTSGENYKEIRITVDTLQDYILACVIKDNLKDEDVSFQNILRLYDEKPFLKLINSNVIQKKKFESVEAEIEEAKKMLRLQEMDHAAEYLETYFTTGIIACV